MELMYSQNSCVLRGRNPELTSPRAEKLRFPRGGGCPAGQEGACQPAPFNSIITNILNQSQPEHSMPHPTPVSPRRRQRARGMRKEMTEAELRFWNAVRAHRLEDLHFRRQYPVLDYIVDFACPQKRLIVEIDGSHHADGITRIHDRHRDRALTDAGWTVLRFWNDEVMYTCDEVCRMVLLTAGIRA